MKIIYETPTVELIRLETAGGTLAEQSQGAGAPDVDVVDFDWGA